MGVRTTQRSQDGKLCRGRLSWSWSEAAGGPQVTCLFQWGETCVGTTAERSPETDGAGPGLGAGLRGEPDRSALVRGGGGAVPGAGLGGGKAGRGGARPCQGRARAGAGPPAARVPCRRRGRAGWQAAGPQWRGVRAVRPGDGHGRLSGPRRRWRRRGHARLRPIQLRLRLGTRDQNSLGGADAAPAGFPGKVAPGAAPRLLWPRPAMAAALALRGRPEAAAAPHSAPARRRACPTSCRGWGPAWAEAAGAGTLRNQEARPRGLSAGEAAGARIPVRTECRPAGAPPACPPGPASGLRLRRPGPREPPAEGGQPDPAPRRQRGTWPGAPAGK